MFPTNPQLPTPTVALSDCLAPKEWKRPPEEPRSGAAAEMVRYFEAREAYLYPLPCERPRRRRLGPGDWRRVDEICAEAKAALSRYRAEKAALQARKRTGFRQQLLRERFQRRVVALVGELIYRYGLRVKRVVLE